VGRAVARCRGIVADGCVSGYGSELNALLRTWSLAKISLPSVFHRLCVALPMVPAFGRLLLGSLVVSYRLGSIASARFSSRSA
jgi:hypothetical protein